MTQVNFFFENELDINLISDCFKESFKKNFDAKYWFWRFKLNPNSKKVYISYIIENGKLASYYAVSPGVIELNKKKQFIALSNMTMTNPQFKGKGYFKTLAIELFKKLKQNKFIAVYGFANHNSHYGFRKHLNWNDLESLNIFKTNEKLFRFNLSKNLNNYTFRDSEITHQDIRIAQKMTFKSNKIYLLRDINNLNWRLTQNPSQKYFVMKIIKKNNIIGLIFYKLHIGNIDIMEYFYLPTFDEEKYNIFGAGIKFLLNFYKSEINIWSNLYTEEHIVLEKMGFIESNFNSYFGIIPLTDCNEILDIKNWHFRFIDSDIF